MRLKHLLATPEFTRGSGLANRLFQWAQCKVFCYQTGARFVSPRWWRPVPGHLLRGTQAPGNPLTQMAYVGLFQRGSGELAWVRGLGARIVGRTLWAEQLSDAGRPSPHTLIIFNRNNCSFLPLNNFYERLTCDLLAIIRRKHLRRALLSPEPLIGLHIRCGDFLPPPKEGAASEWVGWLQQTPVEWFAETLQAMREAAGAVVPALVASDGTPQQLEPLLRLPQVMVLAPTNPLVDLLILARCRLLLGTGSSTFSAWAAFLGQQTAVTAPGKPMTNWGLEAQRGQMVGLFNPRQPDPSVLQAMVRALEIPSVFATNDWMRRQ